LNEPAFMPEPEIASGPKPTFDRFTVVCVGEDVCGHRHIVVPHGGGLVAFLCRRWCPEQDVASIEPRRRHQYLCGTCWRSRDRLRKERVL
jgi:hypothetical protein